MSETRETVLEIDLAALKHNFDYLKSKIKSSTKFLAVVKAFAYGNDAVAIAQSLQDMGADYFAVAYTSEGVALREGGITLPILVLHPLPAGFQKIIDYNLEPSLYNFKVLDHFVETAGANGKEDYPVHLKFNTGLNRLGFEAQDIKKLHHHMHEQKAIRAKSIFSHLAASEDPNETVFTLKQIEAFKSIVQEFKNSFGYTPLLHLCNTSGILNYPQAHLDMVRSGIGLYGFGNSEEEDKNFIPIASLKSVVSQIHDIAPGETVGYNRAFKSQKSMRTATIPIGHADGITRPYGNGKGFVYIQDQKAPIIGNVCMDMIMVDVTGISCEEGDEVIIFDRDHPAHDLATSAGTISYELVTAISQRVSRRIKSY